MTEWCFSFDVEQQSAIYIVLLPSLKRRPGWSNVAEKIGTISPTSNDTQKMRLKSRLAEQAGLIIIHPDPFTVQWDRIFLSM